MAEPGEGIFPVVCGKEVPLSANPDPGYRFTEWSVTVADGGQVTEPNSPNTTVTVTSDVSLIANFELEDTEGNLHSNTVNGLILLPGKMAALALSGGQARLSIRAR